jgi:uncharacterized membrane protein (DUF373 family)
LNILLLLEVVEAVAKVLTEQVVNMRLVAVAAPVDLEQVFYL